MAEDTLVALGDAMTVGERVRELLDSAGVVNRCSDEECDCRCEWTYGAEEMLAVLARVVEFVGVDDNPMESIPYNSALAHVRAILAGRKP